MLQLYKIIDGCIIDQNLNHELLVKNYEYSCERLYHYCLSYKCIIYIKLMYKSQSLNLFTYPTVWQETH